MITSYLAKHSAYEFPKRCSSDILEKLAGAVPDAQVDLNSHQVDATLFFRAKRVAKKSHTPAALNDMLLSKLISSELHVKDTEPFSQKFGI